MSIYKHVATDHRMQYNDLETIVCSFLKDTYLSQFLIVRYVANDLDLHSTSPRILKAIELFHLKCNTECSFHDINKYSTKIKIVETTLFGIRHSANDAPSCQIVRNSDNLVYEMVWHRLGVYHRDNDKPSIIQDNVAGRYERWYKHGKLHRENDKPAAINHHYFQLWYLNGELHRDNDQPAFIDLHYMIFKWYKNGMLHRENDLPAFISPGLYRWYLHNEPHRDGDRPAIIKYIENNGVFLEWMWNGYSHRFGDRPAMVTLSNNIPIEQKWYKFGKLHRDYDLPAIIDETKMAWYRDNVMYRDNNLPSLIENGIYHWYYNGYLLRKTFVLN